MPLRNTVSRNVKNLRESGGLSKSELARRAGVSPRTITDIEKDAENISLRTLEGVAEALGVKPGTLLEDRDTESAVRKCVQDAVALLTRALSEI